MKAKFRVAPLRETTPTHQLIDIAPHPDQGVTVTLRPAIPISLRETPNAVKLRFLSVPTLKNTSNLVGE